MNKILITILTALIVLPTITNISITSGELEIKNRNLGREDTRELSKKIKGKHTKIKRFIYNYKGQTPEKFKLRLEFKKQEVTKTEIIKILEEVIRKLKKNSFLLVLN